MAETTFDVSLHLGPGVTTIAKSLDDSENDDLHANDVIDDSDPNKEEVKFTCRLLAGIIMSVFITASIFSILVLYIFCQLDYQVDEKCYYKEYRMPNATRDPVKTPKFG